MYSVAQSTLNKKKRSDYKIDRMKKLKKGLITIPQVITTLYRLNNKNYICGIYT